MKAGAAGQKLHAEKPKQREKLWRHHPSSCKHERLARARYENGTYATGKYEAESKLKCMT